jgi:hypothetical protein
MTTSRSAVSAIGALLAAAQPGCLLPGGTLGLDGTYRGVQVVDVEGTERDFRGAATVEQTYEARTDEVTTYTVEPGTSSDAVAHGARCPVNLKVFGDKLVLDTAVECDAVHDRTTATALGEVREQVFEYQTIRTFEVEPAGEGKVRIYIDSELKTIVQLDEEPATEDERDERVTFDGTRIANEKD